MTNNGPGPVNGIRVTDPVNTKLVTAQTSWTCSATGGGSCPGSGSPTATNLIDTSALNLPNGATATFVVLTKVADAAAGSLVNTVTGTVPTQFTDSDTSNNAPTDTDTITLPDVRITKTDGKTNILRGASNQYTIVVKNFGPGPANTVTITDNVDATKFVGATWACASTGLPGSSCGSTSGTGSIAISNAFLAIGGELTFTMNGNVAATATGNLVNAASVALSAPNDSNNSNNTATDTTTIDIPVTTTTTIPITTTTVRAGGS